MAKWEYRVIDLGAEVDDSPDRVSDYQDMLNSLGDEGWELIAVTETEYIDETDPDEAGIPSGTTVAYLKRQRPVY